MNNFELLNLFESRKSVRSYSERPVETEKLMRCIKAAQLAPSACNAQPWKFIVVDNPSIKSEIADNISGKIVPINHFTRQASLLVAIVREPANFSSSVGQMLKDKEYPLMDIGISAIQFCLQATAEGLGTCIMGWFNERKIKRILGVPLQKRLELIIAVGYPTSGQIHEKKRKPLDEILSFNKY